MEPLHLLETAWQEDPQRKEVLLRRQMARRTMEKGIIHAAGETSQKSQLAFLPLLHHLTHHKNRTPSNRVSPSVAWEEDRYGEMKEKEANDGERNPSKRTQKHLDAVVSK